MTAISKPVASASFHKKHTGVERWQFPYDQTKHDDTYQQLNTCVCKDVQQLQEKKKKQKKKEGEAQKKMYKQDQDTTDEMLLALSQELARWSQVFLWVVNLERCQVVATVRDMQQQHKKEVWQAKEWAAR